MLLLSSTKNTAGKNHNLLIAKNALETWQYSNILGQHQQMKIIFT
jgi:hypothetical protein